MTAPETTALLIDPAAIRDRLAADGFVSPEADTGVPVQVGDGQSNLTYALDVGPRRVVVRRPPPPPYHASAHDVAREAGVVAALAGTEVPAPAVLAVIAEHVDGAPAVVTEFLEGDVVADSFPARLADVPVEALCRRMAEVLAAIHTLPTGRFSQVLKSSPRPYLERQLDHYARLRERLSGPNGSLAAHVEALLRADVPPPVPDVLVHGDLRLGNLLWSPATGPEPRLGAVLDWELAALGDPDADLAYLLMAHPDPAGPANVISDMAGALLGIPRPDRAALAQWYAAAAARTPRRQPWFAAFVRWRASVGLEFFRLRRERGEIPTNAWLESLDEGVPEMLAQAVGHLREEAA
jgi:aminoglycoside phosphotransferase (APT) family kinase protein